MVPDLGDFNDVEVVENWQSLTASFIDGSRLVARTAHDTIVVYVTRVREGKGSKPTKLTYSNKHTL